MGFAWLASRMVLDPSQAAVVLGTAGLAAQRSRNTFRPMIRASQSVLDEVAPHKDALAIAEYEFRNGRILFFGGNSPTGLSSNAFPLLHISEENKFDADDKEGAPVGLAIQRTKNFRQRKIFRERTPSMMTGGISAAFADGTMEYFHVPCPMCGHRARMGWHKDPGVHWVSFDASLPRGKAAKSARYCCASCGEKWKDSDRLAALHEAGKLENFGYVKTREESDTGGIVSLHYPTMCSTLAALDDMVLDFLSSKENPSDLKQWVQGCLGEDWIPEVVQAQDELLTACRTTYQLTDHTNPLDSDEIRAAVDGLPSIITVMIDVQKDHNWVCVRRWWRGGVSALLNFSRVESFADAEGVADLWHKRIVDEHNQRVKDKLPHIENKVYVWCDCGDQSRVDHMEAVLKYGWVATKGNPNANMDGYCRDSDFDLSTGRRKEGMPDSVPSLLLNTNAAKLNLIDRFRGASCRAPRWYIGANTPEAYSRQVTSERYNPETGKWEIRRGMGKNNHLFDCETMAYICAWKHGFNQSQV